MAWPEGWPWSDDTVRRCFARHGDDVYRALGERILQEYEDYLRDVDDAATAHHATERVHWFGALELSFPPGRLRHHLAIWDQEERRRRFLALSPQDQYAIRDGLMQLGGLWRGLHYRATGGTGLTGGVERFRAMQQYGERYVSGTEARIQGTGIALAMGIAGTAQGVNFRMRVLRRVGWSRRPGPLGRSGDPDDPPPPPRPRAGGADDADDGMAGLARGAARPPLRFPVTVPAGTTGTQLRALLRQIWDELPALRSLNRIAGNPTRAGVEEALHEFFRATGVGWQDMPEGAVQRLTGRPGNLATIRDGTLMIERQVLDDPALFHREVTHEICANYVFGVRGVRVFPEIRGAGLPPPRYLEMGVEDGIDRVLTLIAE